MQLIILYVRIIQRGGAVVTGDRRGIQIALIIELSETLIVRLRCNNCPNLTVLRVLLPLNARKSRQFSVLSAKNFGMQSHSSMLSEALKGKRKCPLNLSFKRIAQPPLLLHVIQMKRIFVTFITDVFLFIFLLSPKTIQTR